MTAPKMRQGSDRSADALKSSGQVILQNDRSYKRRIAVVSYVTILLIVFWRSTVTLVAYAAGSELHSHIILIPFITAYLISIRRSRLSRPGRASLLPAIFLGGVGLLTLIADWRWKAALSENDSLSLSAFSLVCFIVAGGFAFLGKKWMAAVAFPIAFLLFMVPLPDAVVERLETASKLASAEAAAFFFNASGTPVLRDGLFFRLPGIVIEVAQECSGIRSSWVLFITSLLASHLFLQSSWRRVVLVAFVIPLGVVRNGFRILVIGWLCVEYGPHMIDSVVHKKGGPMFFLISLVPMFLLLVWLRSSEARKQASPVRTPASE